MPPNGLERLRTPPSDEISCGQPAADQFRDFERTHPHAARLVNVDDFGQRLFLLRRPGRGTAREKPRAAGPGWPCAPEFLERLGQRQIFLHGGLDDFHQSGKRKFKRNGGEFGAGLRAKPHRAG